MFSHITECGANLAGFNKVPDCIKWQYFPNSTVENFWTTYINKHIIDNCLFVSKSCLCLESKSVGNLLLNPGEGHCSAVGTLQLDLGGTGSRRPWIWAVCCTRFTERNTGYQSVCSIPRSYPSALQPPKGTGDHAGRHIYFREIFM